jgi:hypothetical protein
VSGREAVADILKLNDVVDLVIPRGSNALVTYIQVGAGIEWRYLGDLATPSGVIFGRLAS